MRIRVLTDVAYFIFGKETYDYTISSEEYLYITDKVGRGKTRTVATFNPQGWISVIPEEDDDAFIISPFPPDQEDPSPEQVH